MPTTARFGFVVALSLAPACTRTLPIAFAPERAQLAGAAQPFTVAAADGQQLAIGRDWDLVVTMRDGSRNVIEEPLGVTHSDGGLTVVERWGERRFPDPELRSLALERPDTAGTVAVVAVGSALVLGGVWGLAQLFLFAAHPDP